jgi:hypothetical protein
MTSWDAPLGGLPPLPLFESLPLLPDPGPPLPLPDAGLPEPLPLLPPVCGCVSHTVCHTLCVCVCVCDCCVLMCVQSHCVRCHFRRRHLCARVWGSCARE